MIRAAGSSDSQVSRSALQQLCQQYWYPLYTFVRKQGHDSNSAADLTQAFFADLLEREDLKRVDADLGKFRSFLLASVKHFIINHWRRERTAKRGGGVPAISIDFAHANRRFLEIAGDGRPPESEFEREWATTLLDRVHQRLRKEYEQRGRAHVFDKLKMFLAGKSDESTLAAAAQQLSLTEVAAKVTVHRMRARFGEMLRAEIRSTVTSDEDVEEEIQQLFAALRS